MAKSIRQKATKRLTKSASSPINRNLGSRTKELAKVAGTSSRAKTTTAKGRKSMGRKTTTVRKRKRY
jgi:hypothetical protein